MDAVGNWNIGHHWHAPGLSARGIAGNQQQVALVFMCRRSHPYGLGMCFGREGQEASEAS